MAGADISRDRVGESPARVYRLRRRNDRLFLKLSHRKLSSTTYSVKREAGVIGWLKGRLPVPEVLLYSGNAIWECMVMRAVPNSSPTSPAANIPATLRAILARSSWRGGASPSSTNE